MESLQDLVSNIKHEILGSLSSVRADGLQRVDEATSAINNEISDTLESVGGGSKVEDCLLQVRTGGDFYLENIIFWFQAICYLTPAEEETEAGESRKNKEKQKRKEEKRKEKKKKKAKKNKNKNKDKDNDYFDDYEEDYDDDDDDEDDYEDEANTEEEESDVKIEEEDCDVFQCDIVRYGYQAFQLYGKVQTLRQQFDSLSEKWNNKNRLWW